MAKGKKVRQPKGNDSIPRATVTLIGCASLRRHGRRYLRDVKFTITGEEQIAYYQSDSRFRVVIVK